MPATARSKSFDVFIRKLGYSVGLENLLERFRDFGESYGSRETFGYADLLNLVHGKWGLKNAHVLDVFRSLDVVLLNRGEIGVLETGDALGILWHQRRQVDYEQSTRFLLAYALIVADGDIFLNALASSFEPSEFSARVTRMIEYKWTVLENVFSTPLQRSDIYRSVNIEIQGNNPGSRGLSQKEGPLARPEPGVVHLGPLQSTSDRPPIQLSADYMRKVLSSRRGWAISLGLADDLGIPTAGGQRFLEVLYQNGFAGPACFSAWPLNHELYSPLFRHFEAPAKHDSWALMLLVGVALNLVDKQDGWTPQIHESGIEQLRSIFPIYWNLNQSKRMVRNQLLARVAYRYVIACAIPGGRPIPAPEIAEREQERPSPRIHVRPSREAEMTFALR
jgi:hypothetical protein